MGLNKIRPCVELIVWWMGVTEMQPYHKIIRIFKFQSFELGS